METSLARADNPSGTSRRTASFDVTPFPTLLAFGALTSGYFIYHLALRQNFISAFLGGYSAVGSLLVLPFAALPYIRLCATKKHFLTPTDFLFFAMIAVWAIRVAQNIETIGGAAEEHLGIIPQFLAWFFIFRVISFNHRITQLATLVSFGIATIGIIAMTTTGEQSQAEIIYGTILAMDDNLASYQQFAFLYLVLFICVIAIWSTNPLRWLAYVVALGVFFINGARSELIVAVPLVLAAEMTASNKPLILLGGLIAAALIMSNSLTRMLIDLFPNNRLTLLLENLSSDQSLVEREYVNERAWQTVSQNFFAGDYSSYPAGQYAHNIMSVWVDLGFPGFLVFAGLIAGSCWYAFLIVRKRQVGHGSIALVCLAVSSLVLFVFAKSFTYQLFPVMVAMVARYQSYSRAEVVRY